MKKILLSLFILISVKTYCQDVNVLMKQATNYERVLKEDSALLKYKEVLAANTDNMQAMIKVSLLTTSLGARLTVKLQQKEKYETAKTYADKALELDSTNADANYAKALAYFKLSTVDSENKKMVALLKESRLTAEKVLLINPGHGRANFLLGKWNFDIVNTAWTKKAAVRVLYGGIPEATIESAIIFMEKCRNTEPYFVQNFLELGKAYRFNNNPAKALEVFNQLIKLPNRTADDAAWKAEGKKLLAEIQ